MQFLPLFPTFGSQVSNGASLAGALSSGGPQQQAAPQGQTDQALQIFPGAATHPDTGSLWSTPANQSQVSSTPAFPGGNPQWSGLLQPPAQTAPRPFTGDIWATPANPLSVSSVPGYAGGNPGYAGAAPIWQDPSRPATGDVWSTPATPNQVSSQPGYAGGNPQWAQPQWSDPTPIANAVYGGAQQPVPENTPGFNYGSPIPSSQDWNPGPGYGLIDPNRPGAAAYNTAIANGATPAQAAQAAQSAVLLDAWQNNPNQPSYAPLPVQGVLPSLGGTPLYQGAGGSPWLSQPLAGLAPAQPAPVWSSAPASNAWGFRPPNTVPANSAAGSPWLNSSLQPIDAQQPNPWTAPTNQDQASVQSLIMSLIAQVLGGANLQPAY